MKKAVITLLLLLVIVSSLTAGTLSSYTVTIDNMNNGSVVAKEFVFVKEGADSFQQGIKIAPSETVRWQFNVRNFENGIVTETDLYYKLVFTVEAAAGKQAIQPLMVTVRDQNGNEMASVTGTGVFNVLGTFPLSATGQTKDYIVELYWPSGNNDIDYAGGDFGTAVRVDAIASQIPLSGETENPNPNHNISVLYETTAPWQNGQSGPHYYQYQMTVTNNTDEPINDWYMRFSLPTDRLSGSIWRARNQSAGLPEGSYNIVNPAYNSQTTDNILPGQSVTFGGQAIGMGVEPVSGVSVGGSNVPASTDIALRYQFGKNALN